MNLTQINLLMLFALGLIILILGWRFKQSHRQDVREFDQFYKRMKGSLGQSPRQPHKSTVVPPDPPPIKIISKIKFHDVGTDSPDQDKIKMICAEFINQPDKHFRML